METQHHNDAITPGDAATGASCRRQAQYRLELRRFGVAYGDRVVLSDVTLSLPWQGITAIVGPAATGKSTLLRTIAGFNGQRPSLQIWGECLYEDRPLSDENRPVLVSQNSRLLTSTLLENLLYRTQERFDATPKEKRERCVEILERVGLREYVDNLNCPVVELPLEVQRVVAIARTLAGDPGLLLVDEPTMGLGEAGSARILNLIKSQAEERAIAVVLHNQQEVRTLDGMTAFLAGGIVQEFRPTLEFFANPATEAGCEFKDNGTCSEPAPDALKENLEPSMQRRLRPPPPDVSIPNGALGPRGFVWLVSGKLAGTPWPGVVADLDYDMKALHRVGVTVLLSLTMRQLDPDMLSEYGITAHWYPIEDMGAPSMEMAKQICAHIDELLEKGETIAIHCRAGLGRTGTMLTAFLIWSGESAMGALEAARQVEPKWVQSDVQVRFLERFARELSDRHQSSNGDSS